MDSLRHFCFKLILTMLALKVGSLSLYAQPDRFLITQFNLGNQVQRDKGMSPLRYMGVLYGGSVHYQKVSYRKTEFLESSLVMGALLNQFGNPIEVFDASVKTYTFYRSNHESKPLLQMGWSNQNLFRWRFNNSFVNYKERADYFTSFGPACYLFLPFQIKNSHWYIDAVSHFQLIGFFIRPSYSTNEPIGFVEGNKTVMESFFQSIRLFHPGCALNFGIKPRLNLELRSGTKFSLSYEYDYCRLGSTQPVAISTGIWSLSWSTRLTKLKQ